MAASAVSRTREEIEEQDQFFIAMRRQCGHRGALHRLDVPMLAAHPGLRSALIVGLCGLGFAFSLTAMVIAWARLRSYIRSMRFEG